MERGKNINYIVTEEAKGAERETDFETLSEKEKRAVRKKLRQCIANAKDNAGERA